MDTSVCLDIAESAAMITPVISGNPYLRFNSLQLDIHIKALSDALNSFQSRQPSSLSTVELRQFADVQHNLANALAARMVVPSTAVEQRPKRPSTTLNMISYISDDRVYAAATTGAPLPPYGLVCASERFNQSTNDLETVIINRSLDALPPVFWPLPTDVASVFANGVRDRYIREPAELARHLLNDLRSNPQLTDEQLLHSVWTDRKLKPSSHSEFAVYSMTCATIATLRAVQAVQTIRPFPTPVPFRGCMLSSAHAAAYAASLVTPTTSSTRGRGRGRKNVKKPVETVTVKQEPIEPVVISDDNVPPAIQLRRARQRASSARYRLRQRNVNLPRVMNLKMMQPSPIVADHHLMNPTVNLSPLDIAKPTLDVNMNNIQDLERIAAIAAEEHALLYGDLATEENVDCNTSLNMDLA
jgi:hypothetical protein